MDLKITHILEESVSNLLRKVNKNIFVGFDLKESVSNLLISVLFWNLDMNIISIKMWVFLIYNANKMFRKITKSS